MTGDKPKIEDFEDAWDWYDAVEAHPKSTTAEKLTAYGYALRCDWSEFDGREARKILDARADEAQALERQVAIQDGMINLGSARYEALRSAVGVFAGRLTPLIDGVMDHGFTDAASILDTLKEDMFAAIADTTPEPAPRDRSAQAKEVDPERLKHHALEVAAIERAVRWFGNRMTRVLKCHVGSKVQWDAPGVEDSYLRDRLEMEVEELVEALSEGTDGDIIHESCDVANFAMMLADRARARQKPEPTEDPRDTAPMYYGDAPFPQDPYRSLKEMARRLPEPIDGHTKPVRDPEKCTHDYKPCPCVGAPEMVSGGPATDIARNRHEAGGSPVPKRGPHSPEGMS